VIYQVVLTERPAPLTWWQMDLKDSRFVPREPDGKQQHMVEIFDILDVGTDLLLRCQPAADYTAETVFDPILAALEQYGLPDGVTFDNDPRFVGSPSGRDFPSAFVRFWQCLGVVVDISPPYAPQHNGCVERLHGTMERECLLIQRPTTLEATRDVMEDFQHHYNTERPNQSIVCGNRPPAQVYPVLPTRPTIPEVIDPDHWLHQVDGVHYARKVKSNGCAVIDSREYYIGKDLAGQDVTFQVDAATASFLVWHQREVSKRLAIKGLVRHELLWSEYVTMIQDDARSQWREYLRKQRQKAMRKRAS
jgi:Integrase core domain